MPFAAIPTSETKPCGNCLSPIPARQPFPYCWSCFKAVRLAEIFGHLDLCAVGPCAAGPSIPAPTPVQVPTRAVQLPAKETRPCVNCLAAIPKRQPISLCEGCFQADRAAESLGQVDISALTHAGALASETKPCRDCVTELVPRRQPYPICPRCFETERLAAEFARLNARLE